MCDHNNRFSLRQFREGGLYAGFIVRIGKSCSFVQNNNGCVFQHNTGDGDSLLFAPGKINAL